MDLGIICRMLFIILENSQPSPIFYKETCTHPSKNLHASQHETKFYTYFKKGWIAQAVSKKFNWNTMAFLVEFHIEDVVDEVQKACHQFYT